MILESFAARPGGAGPGDADLVARANLVARHGAVALANALRYRDLPLLGLSQALAGARWLMRARQLPRTLGAAAAVAAVVLLLCVIPADFDVSGRGTLQPRIRREVFAATDGIVAEVRARHGAPVAVNEVVVVLRRPQLELEFSRVVGEMQTARKKLVAIQAARIERQPGQTSDGASRSSQLAGEAEELKELLSSLEQQKKILDVQKGELEVKSPIAGRVVTWDVTSVLEARPVQRGQILMSVAHLDGPWEVEILVPDDQVGHLLAAEKERGAPLPVSFVVATHPGMTCQGTVASIALATDSEEGTAPSALVRVAFDRNAVPLLRPGATVVPRIHCGRRAIGYVWFHRFWDLIRTRLLF
jgi:biotin carboxyl carrier protein